MTENEGTHQTHSTGHCQGFYSLNLLRGSVDVSDCLSVHFVQTATALNLAQTYLSKSLFSDQTSAVLMPQL